MPPKSELADANHSHEKTPEHKQAESANARLRDSIDWIASAGVAGSAQGSAKSLLDSTRLELVSAGDKKSAAAAQNEPLTEEQKEVREREVRDALDHLKDEREPTDIWVLPQDAAAAREIVDRWKRENPFARVSIHETDENKYKDFKGMSRGEYLNLNSCHKYMFPTAEDVRKMPKNHPMQDTGSWR